MLAWVINLGFAAGAVAVAAPPQTELIGTLITKPALGATLATDSAMEAVLVIDPALSGTLED